MSYLDDDGASNKKRKLDTHHPSSLSLHNIVTSINTHLNSIYLLHGIKNNKSDTNNKNKNYNNDNMIEWMGSELVEINHQLQELHNYVKSKFYCPPQLGDVMCIVARSKLINPITALSLASTSSAMMNHLSPVVSLCHSSSFSLHLLSLFYTLFPHSFLLSFLCFKLFEINNISQQYSFSPGSFHYFKPINLVNVSNLPVPSYVESICLKKNLNRFPFHDLSSTVKRLDVSNSNLRLDLLPSTLTHLTLGVNFIFTIFNLPSKLISLTFYKSSKFNHPISCLPPSLLHLTFGAHFNSSPYPLPKHLQTLKFGRVFNQPLDSLPQSLQELRLGRHFSQPLTALPSKLSILHLTHYDLPLTTLPNSLTKLKIKEQYTLKSDENNEPEFISLPPSLTLLIINTDNDFSPLPPSLHNLSLIVPENVSSQTSIPWEHCTSLDFHYFDTNHDTIWPPNLTSLKFTHDNKDTVLTNLPSTLKRLDISFEFCNGFIEDLPPSISELILRDYFSQPIYNLPPFLLSLTLGNNFNHPINNLPPSLQYLSVGNVFNRSINKLPSSLKTLHVGTSFSKKVTHLPPTLTDLSLPLPSLSCGILPNSISSLKITPTFSDKKFNLWLPVNLKQLEFNLSLNDAKCIVFLDFISWKMDITLDGLIIEK